MNHDLNFEEIDDYDEISGEEQLVLIWCENHEAYEWHWVERDEIPK